MPLQYSKQNTHAAWEYMKHDYIYDNSNLALFNLQVWSIGFFSFGDLWLFVSVDWINYAVRPWGTQVN